MVWEGCLLHRGGVTRCPDGRPVGLDALQATQIVTESHPLEFWPRRRVDAESGGVVGLAAAACPCGSACVGVSLRLSSAAGWRFGSCIYTPAACCTGGALLSPVHGDRRARSRTATRDRPLARPAAAISCVGDEATFVMHSRWCGVPGAEPLCTTCLRRSVPPRHAFLVLFDYHRLATPAPERI
jgi:hypothetical protein